MSGFRSQHQTPLKCAAAILEFLGGSRVAYWGKAARPIGQTQMPGLLSNPTLFFYYLLHITFNYLIAFVSGRFALSVLCCPINVPTISAPIFNALNSTTSGPFARGQVDTCREFLRELQVSVYKKGFKFLELIQVLTLGEENVLAFLCGSSTAAQRMTPARMVQGWATRGHLGWRRLRRTIHVHI